LIALSLTQPWATLIAIGAKRIETRSWSTKYRGLMAIHAAKGFPVEAQQACEGSSFVRALDGGRSSARYYTPPHVGSRRFDGGLPLGQIIATARLLDVRPTKPYDDDEAFRATDECAFGDYSAGRFAWVFDDVTALAVPIPCKGALSLWDVPAGIYEAIAPQLLLAARRME